jgi:hypothetical protein
MKNVALGALMTCALASNAIAQTAETPTSVAPPVNAPAPAATAPAPIQAIATVSQQPQSLLPSNTEVSLTMNEDLTTKGGRIDEGHMFRLTVSQDVRIGNFIVIPRGTPAFGEVTWLTGKGAFGKSGKMEIDLRYVDLNGRRIPVTGHYRQEGEGNTVGTVVGVIAVGVFAGFITGKSARIPQGRELKAFTSEPVPVLLPAAAPVAAVPVQAVPSVAPAVAVVTPGTKLR